MSMQLANDLLYAPANMQQCANCPLLSNKGTKECDACGLTSFKAVYVADDGDIYPRDQQEVLAPEDTDPWACESCTFLNSSFLPHCETCNTAKVTYLSQNPGEGEEEEKEFPATCKWCDERAEVDGMCVSCHGKKTDLELCHKNIKDAEAELEKAQQLLTEDKARLAKLGVGTTQWVRLNNGIPYREQAVKSAKAGIEIAESTLRYIQEN